MVGVASRERDRCPLQTNRRYLGLDARGHRNAWMGDAERGDDGPARARGDQTLFPYRRVLQRHSELEPIQDSGVAGSAKGQL